MFSTITSGIASRHSWQKRSHSAATLSSLNGSIAMIEFSPDGSILSANALFLARMGYTLAEIEDQHHSLFCTAEQLESREYKDF